MTDGTALPNRLPPAKSTAEDAPKDTTADAQKGVVEGHADPRQAIFDARFATLTDGFGQACEREGVTTAVAIAVHPDEPHPIIFIRGHQYDAASLLARVMRAIRNELYAGLE